MIQVEQEMLDFASGIVEECKYSFLSKEDIVKNFREYGFLVSENRMIGYTSYLEYDRTKKRGGISFSIEDDIKKQTQVLLYNFCAFVLSNEEKIKFYYKDIPGKNRIRRIARCIVEASSNKEFPIDNDTSYGSMQEGGKSK